MYSSQRCNVGELLPASVCGLLARVSAELSCPICLSVLHAPMQTPCHHAFCKECIERALRVSVEKTNAAFSQQCPVCKAKLSKRSLIMAENLQSLVNGFNVLCKAYKATHDGQDYYHAEDDPKPTAKKYNLYALLMEREKRLDELYLRGNVSSINHDQITSLSTMSIQIPSSPDPFLFQSIPSIPSSPRSEEEKATKTMLAKKSQQQLSSPKHDMKGFKFVCTSFLKTEQSKVTDFAKAFKMHCKDKVSLKTLLFMADQEGIVKRSFKYMIAILLGQPVLPIKYMTDCLSAGQLLQNLDDYMIKGDEFGSNNVVLKSIECHWKNEPGPFHNLQFYFYGKFERPSLLELQQLVSAGSGLIVDHASKLSKGVVLVCDPAMTGSFEKDAGIIAKHRPIISIHWIMDCISTYSLLDRHTYIVL